jgi:hypothetical protein
MRKGSCSRPGPRSPTGCWSSASGICGRSWLSMRPITTDVAPIAAVSSARPAPTTLPPTCPRSESSVGPSLVASSANTSEPPKSPGQDWWPSSGTPQGPLPVTGGRPGRERIGHRGPPSGPGAARRLGRGSVASHPQRRRCDRSGTSGPASGGRTGGTRLPADLATGAGRAQELPVTSRLQRALHRPDDYPCQGASGSVNRCFCPDAVRHVSVTIAIQRPAAAHRDTRRDISQTPRAPENPQATGRFRWWWQVLGSNQRRLSRRFYRETAVSLTVRL